MSLKITITPCLSIPVHPFATKRTMLIADGKTIKLRLTWHLDNRLITKGTLQILKKHVLIKFMLLICKYFQQISIWIEKAIYEMLFVGWIRQARRLVGWYQRLFDSPALFWFRQKRPTFQPQIWVLTRQLSRPMLRNTIRHTQTLQMVFGESFVYNMTKLSSFCQLK